MRLVKLIDEEIIKRFIISTRGKIDSDNSITYIVVMNGGEYFFNKLNSTCEFPGQVLKIKASSYLGTERSSHGVVFENEELFKEIKYDRIYVIDDICDTGKTFSTIVTKIKETFPEREFIITPVFMFEKNVNLRYPIQPLALPRKAFVIGCGLDYYGKYREFDELYELIV